MAATPLSETLLFVDRDMQSGEVHPIGPGSAAVLSARSPDKVSANEDCAALIPFAADSGILVVADGVGGMPAGEEASRLAVEALRGAVIRARRDGAELRDAIMNGIEDANRAVSDLGVGAATTLAAVELQGCTVRPYHVGDSMILVMGQRGRLKLQTVSHSPVGYAIEAGLLDEQEAMHHEERHLVLNTIGSANMRIEVGSALRLAPRDTLLLATDGVFDNLQTEEIVALGRTGPLDSAVDRIARTCHERMANPEAAHVSKPDDLTMIAFRCGCVRRRS